MGIRRCIIILIILFNLCLFNAQGQTSQQVKNPHIYKGSPFTPELVQRQTRRAELSKIDMLIDVLGIKPGMVILDIGAGSGQYAYKFAERLKGTGKVFATDINIDAVNYIREQVRVRNLLNLFPVLVNSEGLDEFYTNNKFDLIFIAHAYHLFSDGVDYFKRLKGSLTKNGRLVILTLQSPKEFSSSDISDVRGLIKQLSSEKFDSPFYSCLRETTRELLDRPLEDKTEESLKNVIVGDLNIMKDDIYFLNHFLKDGLTFKEEIPFTREEKDFVNMYLRFLKLEAKAFDNAGALDMSNRDIFSKPLFMPILRRINMVLIVQKFRQYLYYGKPAPYLPGGYGHWQDSLAIQKLSLAGYSLIHEYDFIPFEVIEVFTPNNSS